jgi:hypothetical protein
VDIHPQARQHVIFDDRELLQRLEDLHVLF